MGWLRACLSGAPSACTPHTTTQLLGYVALSAVTFALIAAAWAAWYALTG